MQLLVDVVLMEISAGTFTLMEKEKKKNHI